MNTIDLAKLNAADDMTGLIEENVNVAPELSRVPAFTIKGTSFNTVIRTGVPSGGFKPLGAGIAPGAQTFGNKLVQCFNYENPLRETADRVRSYRRGSAAALALAASGAMQGAMQLIGKSFYYGARSFGGGTDSMPGLIDLYDSTNKVVDAGGTTADTGSSVYFIKFGNQEDGNVSFVFGDERVFSMREWLLQQINLGTEAAPKLTDAFTNSLACAVGVQLTNIHAVVRIKKLTEDANKGLTDTVGYKALEKFPVGMKPDFAFMTKRSARQLRDSRTGTNGGAPNIAWPTDICGVPIIETDSILNTEALTL